MATVAEKLNNAIYSLASLNPTTPAANILNDHWQTWWSTHRLFAPDAAWWAVLRTFWVAYAGARAIAPNTNERTPPAMEIEPTGWKLALEQVRASGEGFDEAAIYGRKIEQSASDFARQIESRVNQLPETIEKLKEEIGDVTRNVLFVTGALALAWVVWRHRR